MWEIHHYAWLNINYFAFKPGHYKSLCDTIAPANDYVYFLSNVRIDINSGKYYEALDTVYIPVTIHNLSDMPLRSNAGDQVSLSYFWVYHKEILDWDGLHTPLETDVFQSLRQYMKVATPLQKGRYQLMVDIKVENKMWFGLSSQADILIY